MRKFKEPESWVVYLMNNRGKMGAMTAVCEQREWEAMELAQPGHHTLIRDKIVNEGEAEQYARSHPAVAAAAS